MNRVAFNIFSTQRKIGMTLKSIFGPEIAGSPRRDRDFYWTHRDSGKMRYGDPEIQIAKKMNAMFFILFSTQRKIDVPQKPVFGRENAGSPHWDFEEVSVFRWGIWLVWVPNSAWSILTSSEHSKGTLLDLPLLSWPSLAQCLNILTRIPKS